MILENKLYQNTECTVFILKHTHISTVKNDIIDIRVPKLLLIPRQLRLFRDVRKKLDIDELVIKHIYLCLTNRKIGIV